jgi:hypothetical protein
MTTSLTKTALFCVCLSIFFEGALRQVNAESQLRETDSATAIQTIREVSAEGRNFPQAQMAASKLSVLPSSEVFVVLDAMEDADPVAQNWFRGIASGIVTKSGYPGLAELKSYVEDHTRAADGRAMAMIWLKEISADTYQTILDQSLNDPSLLIRELAVARQTELADKIADQQPEQAKEQLRQSLQAARHPAQLSKVLKKLNDLGDPVTTAQAFAMIKGWQAIGPFDNVNGVGFDQPYPPELNFVDSGKVQLDSSHEGKNGSVSWKPIEATGDDGTVDLASSYSKEKGAVAYVYTEFEWDADADAEIRLGCICGNQAWLNGKLVMSNEVYHSGSMIDQYTAKVSLKKGTNRILLKICQNEQTESWAQDWEFQCRVTDPTGKGLVSQ